MIVYDGSLGIASDPLVALPIGLPGLGMRFGMDDLAAAFLIITNIGAAAVSLFALGYARHEANPGASCRSTRRFWPP